MSTTNGSNNGNGHVKRERAPAGGIRIRGKTYKGGALLPVKYGREHEPGQPSLDPAYGVDGIPPNVGQPVVRHALTYQGLVSTLAKVYMPSDEAVRNSVPNALIMRKDCFISECLETRQRATALFNWHLEPEDKHDQELKEACDGITQMLRDFPRFTEYRRSLLDGIWFGKQGMAHSWALNYRRGKAVRYIRDWTPVCGDKLLFRYDDGSGQFDPQQVGIRVNPMHAKDGYFGGRKVLELAGVGTGYFLEPWERALCAIHKHMIEDAMYEDPYRAGAINGVGIRDRIYWSWYQRQETMAQLMEVVVRTGQGVWIYWYEEGNAQSEAAMLKVAEQQAHTNYILMPQNPERDTANGIELIPANTAGLEALQTIAHGLFGHQIKRYILGQTLSTESDSTGLGSGVADLHMESLYQVIKYDSVNLEETITRDVVYRLQQYNYPRTVGRNIYFKIDTEDPQTEKVMAGFESAWNMGLKIKASDVADIIGAAMPGENDEVLQNPQMAQGGQQQQVGGSTVNGFSPERDGPGGGQGEPTNEDLFGPLATATEVEGEPEQAEKMQRDGQADHYAAWASTITPTHHVGETKTEGGKTYVLSSNHRWTLRDKPGTPIDHPNIDKADSTIKRQQTVEKSVGLVHPSVGSLIKEFHSDKFYTAHANAHGRPIRPEQGREVYAWMQQNAGKKVGGGRVVDLGEGQFGFSSAAGAIVLRPPADADEPWLAKYTIHTKPVAEAAGIAHEPTKPASKPETAKESTDAGNLADTTEFKPEADSHSPKPSAEPVKASSFATGEQIHGDLPAFKERLNQFQDDGGSFVLHTEGPNGVEKIPVKWDGKDFRDSHDRKRSINASIANGGDESGVEFVPAGQSAEVPKAASQSAMQSQPAAPRPATGPQPDHPTIPAAMVSKLKALGLTDEGIARATSAGTATELAKARKEPDAASGEMPETDPINIAEREISVGKAPKTAPQRGWAKALLAEARKNLTAERRKKPDNEPPEELGQGAKPEPKAPQDAPKGAEPVSTPGEPSKPRGRPRTAPHGPDELKEHLPKYLAGAGIAHTPENVAAIHKAIEGGNIAHGVQLARVLNTAKRLHERDDINTPDTPHVIEALKQQGQPAPRRS